MTSDASGNATWGAAPATGLTGWVDVTKFAGTPCLPANTAAQNITAINAIMAASPAGSTIYFPGGTYAFNAAWTMPAAKQFFFQGQGSGISGGNTLLSWTSNVGATWIVLASSTFYYSFNNLTFISTGVTQTAGGVIDVNGNSACNIQNCTFGSLSGGFLNDIIIGTATGFGQSFNSAVIQNCVMSGFKGRGIFSDSNTSSMVVTGCVIQGQFGPSTGAFGATTQALAGIQINAGGAFQINNCDILGAINNLLFSPTTGEVNASVFCSDTYFDNSGGSCIKVTGAGASVRIRFDTCSFTTAGTNFSGGAGTSIHAVEIAGTYAAFTTTAGQGVDFVNCNVLNTFGTTGTSNGFLITNAADFSITNCRIAGWFTAGINVNPIATTGVTKPMISNNTIGPAGGYGGNTTGIILNGGAAAYGNIMIVANNLAGNTLAFSDSSTVSVATGGAKVIAKNAGLVTARPANVAATLIALTTTTQMDSLGGLPFPANARPGTTVRGTAFLTNAATAQTLTLRLLFGINNTSADTQITGAILTVGTTTLGSAVVEFEFTLVTATTALGKVLVTSSGGVTAAGQQAGTSTGLVTVATTAQTFLGMYASSATAAAVTVRSIVWEVLSQ